MELIARSFYRAGPSSELCFAAECGMGAVKHHVAGRTYPLPLPALILRTAAFGRCREVSGTKGDTASCESVFAPCSFTNCSNYIYLPFCLFIYLTILSLQSALVQWQDPEYRFYTSANSYCPWGVPRDIYLVLITGPQRIFGCEGVQN